jgi:hypothetical protein
VNDSPVPAVHFVRLTVERSGAGNCDVMFLNA